MHYLVLRVRLQLLAWQKQHFAPMLKLLALVFVVGVFWNVTMASRAIETETTSVQVPEVHAIANNSLRGPVVSEPIAHSAERPWFLQPETYRTKSGCDFSGVVERFKPENLDVNCDNMDQLELGEFVGKGAWREVYKSNWKGRQVVVKRVLINMEGQKNILPQHVQEVAAIFPIRNEPNIVGLVGWCNTTMMVDYIPQTLNKIIFDSEEPISVRMALEMSGDAARGLAQLHNAPGGPFAHADIKPEQFLVDSENKLHLNDFNLVMFAGPRRQEGVPTNEKCTFKYPYSGPSRWRAPEETKNAPLDEKIDVFSLSLVMWTTRSRTWPFHRLEPHEAFDRMRNGDRPAVSTMSDFPKEMQELIVKGWDQDPKKRPSAMEMAQEIDRILEKYRAEN